MRTRPFFRPQQDLSVDASEGNSCAIRRCPAASYDASNRQENNSPDRFRILLISRLNFGGVIRSIGATGRGRSIWRSVGFRSRDGTGGDGLPRLRSLAGRDDGMCTAICDSIVALAGVLGAHRADLFDKRDLAEQIGQGRRNPIRALGNLDGSNLLCSSSIPRWILHREPCPPLVPRPMASTPLGATMPAGLPPTCGLAVNAHANDYQMHRPFDPR